MITLEAVKASHLVETTHVNYGADGGGYISRCVEFPRLQALDRVYRGAAARKAGKPGERFWRVDGQQVDSIEVALAIVSRSHPTNKRIAIEDDCPASALRRAAAEAASIA
jgi:hypothetical protein